MTSLSATASLVSSGDISTASAGKLVKLANGEYSADSVSKDPTDAQKPGLRREKDGNCGAAMPSAATGSAAASATSGVQSALFSLTLGGQ